MLPPDRPVPQLTRAPAKGGWGTARSRPATARDTLRVYSAYIRIVHVRHLPFLQQAARRQRGAGNLPGREAPRLRCRQGTPLGGVSALRALEPFAARGAMGGDRVRRTAVP